MAVPKSAFELLSGETDRHKIFHIARSSEAVQTWVQGLMTE
jgi:uncharacterized protein YggU (UPF0235/DUF167 family)